MIKGKKKILLLIVTGIHFVLVVLSGMPSREQIEIAQSEQYVPSFYKKIWVEVVDYIKERQLMGISNQYTRFAGIQAKWILFSFPVTRPQVQYFVNDNDSKLLVFDSYSEPGEIVNSGLALNKLDLDWRFIHGHNFVFYNSSPNIRKREFYYQGLFFLNRLESIARRNYNNFSVRLIWHCEESPLYNRETNCKKKVKEFSYYKGQIGQL